MNKTGNHVAQICDGNIRRIMIIIFVILLGINITQNKWIEATMPKNNDIDVLSKTNIEILFKQDMDKATLNADNIQIFEGKHSRNISLIFEYIYNPNTRILNIKFKDSASDFGTSNAIDVIVTGRVCNFKGKQMGKDYIFSFAIK